MSRETLERKPMQLSYMIIPCHLSLELRAIDISRENKNRTDILSRLASVET